MTNVTDLSKLARSLDFFLQNEVGLKKVYIALVVSFDKKKVRKIQKIVVGCLDTQQNDI